MRCVSFGTAVNYNLNAVAAFAKSKGLITKISRNVLQVSYPQRRGDIFFFTHGCFVCWGLTRLLEQQWLEITKDFSINPLKKVERDYFSYHISKETDLYTHERFNIDVITLEDEDASLKLAISYGLAQSVKLESYEEVVERTIQINQQLPLELVQKGRIPLSRKAILQRIGGIFIERSSINLRSEYLDTPEYFWRHPTVEPYYIMTVQFLDVTSRVQSLNQKLDVMHDMFDVLTTQLQYRHTTMLEIIIIMLILVEVIIAVLQFHLV